MINQNNFNKVNKYAEIFNFFVEQYIKDSSEQKLSEDQFLHIKLKIYSVIQIKTAKFLYEHLGQEKTDKLIKLINKEDQKSFLFSLKNFFEEHGESFKEKEIKQIKNIYKETMLNILKVHKEKKFKEIDEQKFLQIIEDMDQTD